MQPTLLAQSMRSSSWPPVLLSSDPYSRWMCDTLIKTVQFSLLLCFLFSCQETPTAEQHQEATVKSLLQDSPSIAGKPAYLASPFVTAGNRVYLVGHQDGSFPELGWHIKGEMGGIWDHPIKLMDGFDVELIPMGIGRENEVISLNNAQTFTNYPLANQHLFTLAAKNLEIERWQFVPDDQEGIAIQFLLNNKGTSPLQFDFRFTGHTDLRPTWLSERLQQTDHPDQATFNDQLGAWVARDSVQPWFAVFGGDRQAEAHQIAQMTYAGKGIANSLDYPITLAANTATLLTFVIAGSYQSETEAIATYQTIQAQLVPLLKAKQERYEQLASYSRLSIPDKKLQETFAWLKYNSDWLVRTVPEIGTGIGAGIPDYPWWFGVDSEYALKGYMAIGQHDIVYQTIALLDSLSEAANGNGRIVHEVSTNGIVFNPGNINETPQFASLIWEIYQWNGDPDFLKQYFPTIKKGLHWLLEENDANKNLFPDGFGMMEIHGLNSEMIDVAAYTQKAFADAAQMATVLGEDSLANAYATTAATLKEKINTEFWSEAFNSYADFIGTDAQALKLIEDAIVRADTLKKPWAVAELENTKATILENPSKTARPFVLHHNWVVNTPMEMQIADTAKARRALQTAEQFVNPFGVFVTGIDRDETAGADEGSFQGSKVFSYTGAVMTLPTGVLAVAENNYQRPDQALKYLQSMARSFSYALPGSMYEVSPDYGMMTQAWNIYSFAIPIVKQFFGIQPQAAQQQVFIRPQMPGSWDQASLENVRIGDNEVSVFYKKSNGLLSLTVEQTNPEWTINIEFPATFNGTTYAVKESSAEVKIINDKITIATKQLKTALQLKYK